MTLVENHSPDRVQFGERKQVDVLDDEVHKVPEMPGSLQTCIYVVSCCGGKQVIDIRFQVEQDLSSIMRGDLGNF